MEDTITFTLPNHTEENPVLQREDISETYHLNWNQYSVAKNKDQKDQDDGKKLNGSNSH